jgi:class 3 adenylate cyclase
MPGPVETRFATAADGTYIAYQVSGEGPLDIVWLRAWHSNIEHEWDEPVLGRVLRRLGTMGRVIRLDQRGTGLSDRIAYRPAPTLEDRSDDIRAVLEAVGARPAVLLGIASGGVLCAAFAAMHPRLTRGLVLYHTVPGRAWGDDSAPADDPRLERFVDAVRAGWGTEAFAQRMVASAAPSRASDRSLITWMAEDERLSGTVEDAVALARIDHATDLRPILPAIHVPTLVVTRTGVAVEAARLLASSIESARYVELPGEDHMLVAGDTDAVLREIGRFLDSLPDDGPPGPGTEDDAERVLATLLMTDIVGSTEHVTDLGDRRWAALLQAHDERVRAALARYRGREIDTAGDGFLAAFDGPGRAIRCALEASRELRGLGLEIRAGIHAGEVEQVGPRVRGIAVHIAARVASVAGPSEVLVSRTVRDLVAGSGLGFAPRGAHRLKGIPGEWELFAAHDPSSEPGPASEDPSRPPAS